MNIKEQTAKYLCKKALKHNLLVIKRYLKKRAGILGNSPGKSLLLQLQPLKKVQLTPLQQKIIEDVKQLPQHPFLSNTVDLNGNVVKSFAQSSTNGLSKNQLKRQMWYAKHPLVFLSPTLMLASMPLPKRLQGLTSQQYLKRIYYSPNRQFMNFGSILPGLTKLKAALRLKRLPLDQKGLMVYNPLTSALNQMFSDQLKAAGITLANKKNVVNKLSPDSFLNQLADAKNTANILSMYNRMSGSDLSKILSIMGWLAALDALIGKTLAVLGSATVSGTAAAKAAVAKEGVKGIAKQIPKFIALNMTKEKAKQFAINRAKLAGVYTLSNMALKLPTAYYAYKYNDLALTNPQLYARKMQLAKAMLPFVGGAAAAIGGKFAFGKQPFISAMKPAAVQIAMDSFFNKMYPTYTTDMQGMTTGLDVMQMTNGTGYIDPRKQQQMRLFSLIKKHPWKAPVLNAVKFLQLMPGTSMALSAADYLLGTDLYGKVNSALPDFARSEAPYDAMNANQRAKAVLDRLRFEQATGDLKASLQNVPQLKQLDTVHALQKFNAGDYQSITPLLQQALQLFTQQNPDAVTSLQQIDQLQRDAAENPLIGNIGKPSDIPAPSRLQAVSYNFVDNNRLQIANVVRQRVAEDIYLRQQIAKLKDPVKKQLLAKQYFQQKNKSISPLDFKQILGRTALNNLSLVLRLKFINLNITNNLRNNVSFDSRVKAALGSLYLDKYALDNNIKMRLDTFDKAVAAGVFANLANKLSQDIVNPLKTSLSDITTSMIALGNSNAGDSKEAKQIKAAYFNRLGYLLLKCLNPILLSKSLLQLYSKGLSDDPQLNQFKKKMTDKVWLFVGNNPGQLNQAIGLWLRSKGMSDLAGIALNDAAFYIGIPLLLVGLPLTAGMLMSGDKQQPNRVTNNDNPYYVQGLPRFA